MNAVFRSVGAADNSLSILGFHGVPELVCVCVCEGEAAGQMLNKPNTRNIYHLPLGLSRGFTSGTVSQSKHTK